MPWSCARAPPRWWTSSGRSGPIPAPSGAAATPAPLDRTLRRKLSVAAGDANGADAFVPATEWDGFAQDTVDNLGLAPVAAEPVINEFSASTAGTDVEYVEVKGAAGTDLAAYKVLEIEGDAGGTALGTVDEVVSLGTTDAEGYALVSLAANALENGTITLLLVKDFTGALTNDLDTNDDGTLDTQPWASVVDAVAVNDGGAGDRTYGSPSLGVAYDGQPFAPGWRLAHPRRHRHRHRRRLDAQRLRPGRHPGQRRHADRGRGPQHPR